MDMWLFFGSNSLWSLYTEFLEEVYFHERHREKYLRVHPYIFYLGASILEIKKTDY